MISLKISEDLKRIEFVKSSLNSEKSRYFKYFRKKSKDAKFNVLVERGIWDGYDHFISEDGSIKIELWKEVFNFSEKNDIEVDLEGQDRLFKNSIDRGAYLKFVDSLFENVINNSGDPIYPRDYQFEAAYRALKYKFSCEELATSAGKTLIFYTFNSYLNWKGIVSKDRKSLLIVPNVSLVNQTADAFSEYSNGLVDWNILTIGGKEGDFDEDLFRECNMVITTYQSLINLIPSAIEERIEKLQKKRVKKGESEKRASELARLKRNLNRAKLLNIGSKFSSVCVDEAHKSRGNSISQILKSCTNWEYKLGLSGTLKINEQFSDFFMMQENVGPLVMMLDAKFLIDNKYSPNIKICQVFLDYDQSDKKTSEYVKIQSDPDVKASVKSQFKDPKEFGRQMLSIEKEIIIENSRRLEVISKMVQRFDGNTLILFSDVKNEYGVRIKDRISEWNPNVYYIDGEVEDSDRAEYKKIMESTEGAVIVASYGTFATGIDLKRVHHIIFSESTKAEITIRQAIGRGMRGLIGKTVVHIWDLVDDLSGYSIRHGLERLSIYKEQRFTVLDPKRVSLDK